jgi:hypothetical protein
MKGFSKIVGIITGILIFILLLPVFLKGLNSISSIGIFLIIGPVIIAFLGGAIMAGVLQYISDLFK